MATECGESNIQQILTNSRSTWHAWNNEPTARATIITRSLLPANGGYGFPSFYFRPRVYLFLGHGAAANARVRNEVTDVCFLVPRSNIDRTGSQFVFGANQ